MKKETLTLLFLFFIQIYFSQVKKIYYDSDWKVSNLSEAEYYRLVSFDKNGKPIGKVKDYYMSGVLQWEGQLSYMDKFDNSKDVIDGKCIFYTRQGKKERIDYYKNGEIIKPSIYFYYYPSGKLKSKISVKYGKKEGESIWYYENGEIRSRGFYNENKANGLYTWFEENGEINTINIYDNGVPISKFWIKYDSYNKSFYKSFSDNFNNKKNPNGWQIGKDKYGRKSEYVEGGISYRMYEKGGNRNSIDLNLINNRDYTISVELERILGPQGKPFGVIWGFKNWDNYNYFYISSYGGYKIGTHLDGFEITDGWQSKTSAVNKNSSNELRIKKVNDKMYFAINGKLVDSKESYSLFGSEIGFIVYGKNNTILMKKIQVSQKLTEDDLKDLIAKHYRSTNNEDEISKSTNSIKEWKGSGSGFFIDKKGYIVTNYHVIKDSNEIEIEFIRNGTKYSFPAKIIRSDKQNDISIIKISSTEFTPFVNLPYNFKTKISDVGSNVFALGYPLLSLMGNEIKFTDGKISSKTGIQGDITSYQISVPIQPGNSGGPLFDYNGNIIGITSSGINRKLDITENVNYAIKSSYLKNLIDVLDYRLELPNDISISNLKLTEKIKKISDYVVLIKTK